MLAGVLLAVPTLAAFYLPMSDLPLHEGVVGILRHWGDPTWFPPDLYVRNLFQSNQLFYLVSWILSYAVGTRWAVKIFVAVTQVLIFWAGGRLADHLGRSRWSVLFLTPLVLGFTYFWGLVANLLGFVTLLAALPVLDRGAQRPTPRTAVASSGVLLLLYFAHGSSFVAGCGFAAVLAVLHPWTRRETALRFVPVLFACVFFVAMYLRAEKNMMPWQVDFVTVFTPLLTRFEYLPNVLFGSHDLPAQLALFGIAVVGVAALAVTRFRTERGEPVVAPAHASPPSRLDRARAALLAYRMELTGLCFLLGYFAMPFAWHGATLIYQRFFGPAWAVLVIAFAPRGPAPRVAKVAGAVLPLGVLLVSWPQFADADRTFRDMESLLEKIPMNRAITQVSLEPPIYRERVYSVAAGPARSVAVRGGRAGQSLTISGLSPILMNPAYRWDDYDYRMARSSRRLVPPHDLDRWEWVIVQSRDVGTRQLMVAALAPHATYVADAGEWVLFHSTHEVAPLTSPEVPAPPNSPTIVDRVNTLVQRAREAK